MTGSANPPEISVIVPFHGVEAFIETCLDSLHRQTYENIEVLCIDDASTDGSLEIARRYEAKDPRFRVIRHTRNKGLGGARNTGIANARGDYVSFVDSDDYVSDEFIYRLHRAAALDRSDIVVCGFQTFKAPENPLRRVCPEAGVHDLEGSPGKALGLANQVRNASWLKLYRRDLLIRHGLSQPEHRYFEDVVFWVRAALHSRRITTLAEPLYYYRIRPGSIMTTFSVRHNDDRVAFIEELLYLLHDEVLTRPQADPESTLGHARALLLKHIRYGSTLIEESGLPDPEPSLRDYREKIERLSGTEPWRKILPDRAL